jgi:ParB family chromosome partitioning protein
MTPPDIPRRRVDLKALLGDIAPAVPPATAAPAQPGPPPVARGRDVSGSVKAMRLSLGEIGRKAAESEAMRAALEAGERAVELDPAVIEPSFVVDRLDRGGEAKEPDFRAFVEDLRAHGQLTPILVRPHPDKAGTYQIAFGHRRWRAARLLGRPVRAIVRPLDDAALVVAQGQENAQRRDLSFIEKAMFARALEERGFPRATITAALALHASEVARLLGVARELPADLARAIGPAPRAGRPRWMTLVEALKGQGAAERARAALTDPGSSDSDARFVAALAACRPPRPDAPDAAEAEVTDAQGVVVARVTRRGASVRFDIDARRAPDLARKVEAMLRREAARQGARSDIAMHKES